MNSPVIKLVTITLLILTLLYSPDPVFADNCSDSGATTPAQCGNAGKNCQWKNSTCVVNPQFNMNSGAFSGALSDPTFDPLHGQFADIGSVINKLLPYALTFAGLILFAMLIWGGFQLMTAGTDAKKADAGKARITTAIAGFVIVFGAYWIAQILEIILGINIVSN